MIALESSPRWTVMPIGDGSLEYRLDDRGKCLCRALGDEALQASVRLLGSPAETSAEGHPVWELYAGEQAD